MPVSRPAPQELIDAAPVSESLRVLARAGEVRRYARGALLIQEGDRGDTVYIILAGRLRAYSGSDASAREVTYGVYGPGEYVGEMGLDGGPRSANVIALDPVVCARVGRATLLEHIAAHPEFALELLAKVIRRARAATLGMKQIALNDVYGRLKLLLEAHAGRPDARGLRPIAERMTHADIAARIGCSREMVSRLMKELGVGGYVKSAGRGRVVLAAPLPPRW
jgi:CRP/FNR family cyclic AMP-dependent transcriptional regulator